MAGTTSHYGLTTVAEGESLSDDDYKFTQEDRETIDRLLYLGAEGHHHLGGIAEVVDAPDVPDLELELTGGTLPSGTRITYKIAWVNVRGEETAASTEVYVDTPTPIAEPAGPTVAYETTGGALSPGVYYYALSAWVNEETSETLEGDTAFLTIPSGTVTNAITLTLPDLPSGAHGFNVYRRTPGQTRYFYLDSIDLDVATPPTIYLDDGSVAEDCDRSLPVENNTNSSSSIVITVPDGIVPDGMTWKIYRSYIAGDWSESLLTQVVEYVDEATPTITPTFTDVGNSTGGGTPRTTALQTSNPSKIDLATETTGILPRSMVESDPALPLEVSFAFEGYIQPMVGTFVWPCSYPEATIVGVRCALGRGYSPAVDDVVIDVLKGTAATTPVYTTIYTDPLDRPSVPVGEQIGAIAIPDVDTVVEGESLVLDIIQAGGGATPTDKDLTVVILLELTR